MRHKYLPRVWTVVLGLGGALGAGAGLACSDSTAPATRGAQLALSLETPPSDSLGQLGVGISVMRSDSALLRDVRVYVDSGAASAQVATIPGLSRVDEPYGPAKRWAGAVALPGPGRHTMTVVGIDTLGRALSASVAWTVRLPGEAYALAALPDSGHSSGTRFVHTDGTVAGWIGGADGRHRAALWRNGITTVLATPDSFSATATRVNASGDVLLELRPGSTPTTQGDYVRVRRADGATLLVVGPHSASYHATNGSRDTTITFAACCTAGVDLTDTRLAVGASDQAPVFDYYSVVLDVARGTRVDSTRGLLVALNNAGQSVESFTYYGGPYIGMGLFPHGFTMAGLPNARVASECDLVGRWFTLVPIDLDESANVLASYCGNPVWLPTVAGTSRWLDRAVGRSKAVHLSRTGGIIASLDSAGAIYLWRPATNRTTQVQIAGGAWRIDSLAAVNASGQIAAHGVERATGRGAALLLTPAP